MIKELTKNNKTKIVALHEWIQSTAEPRLSAIVAVFLYTFIVFTNISPVELFFLVTTLTFDSYIYITMLRPMFLNTFSSVDLNCFLDVLN